MRARSTSRSSASSFSTAANGAASKSSRRNASRNRPRPDRNDRRPWKTYPEWAEASGYYKYFWWGDTNGSGDYVYSAIGRWGQFIFVAPKANVVIVRTGSDFGINIV
jgi:CubicO group peptidase (beta-lactamase class C family)